MHNGITVDIIKNKKIEHVYKAYLVSTNEEESTLAYRFMCGLVVSLGDISYVVGLLDLDKIRMQLNSFAENGCNSIYWVLYNVLVDDCEGEGFFRRIIGDHLFLTCLIGNMMRWINKYSYNSMDLINCIILRSDKSIMIDLIKKYNFLELPFTALSKSSDIKSLNFGLNLLEEIIVACVNLFHPAKNEYNPAVRTIISTPHLLSCIEGISSTKFKSVFNSYQLLIENYFPVID